MFKRRVKLDLGENVITSDFTNSLRAGTSAVRSAYDAAESGMADNILVVASDCRIAPPESLEEYLYGDGAAALLIGKRGTIADLKSFHSVTEEFTGPWRKKGDEFVRHFEPKHETKMGFARSVERAVKGLIEKCDVNIDQFHKAAVYSPDPRRHMGVAMGLGLDKKQIQDSLFLSLGDTGTEGYQIEDAEVGLAHNLGGRQSVAMVSILALP